ncbi:MAG TPA: bifunctional nicotinamidase/pyrazinamidase [Pirellulales bacterium]|nr:bifunctional nicotinamidase/pyrazinamidase [Pirellulales bacterium]
MSGDRSATALILVDLQNDFLPGGALPVKDGDAVVPVANRLQSCFPLVVATRDWHPANHVSFAENHPGKHVGDTIEVGGRPQRLWPVHCVVNSFGAAFPTGLDTARVAEVVHKGIDPHVDSYSGFFDNDHVNSTHLADYLKQHHVSTIYLAGLATDYCVKATALDGLSLGFKVALIADACRGIDLSHGDVARSIEEMRAAGAKIVQRDDVLAGRA